MRFVHLIEGGVVAAALVAGAIFGGGAAQQAAQPTAAEQTAAKMSATELVGQRVVTGWQGARPPAWLRTAARDGRIGGVILFKDNIPSTTRARRSIAALQREAKRGGQPPLLVMVDQEGGDVKRIASLPPDRSPRQIGRSADPAATARAEGERTGAALAKLGFNVDLAPVADVPDSAGSFLGERAFARDPETVAQAACAFADGLANGGVAGAFKHFPGLGRARANTDLTRVRVNAGAAELRADLEAYRRCPDQRRLTMVASATYQALGITAPAVLSSRSYELLTETGFSGLTISDALDTPAIEGRSRPEFRAVRAGLDLLLYAQTKGAATRAHRALMREVRAGRLRRTRLREVAARVIEFKQR